MLEPRRVCWPARSYASAPAVSATMDTHVKATTKVRRRLTTRLAFPSRGAEHVVPAEGRQAPIRGLRITSGCTPSSTSSRRARDQCHGRSRCRGSHVLPMSSRQTVETTMDVSDRPRVLQIQVPSTGPCEASSRHSRRRRRATAPRARWRVPSPPRPPVGRHGGEAPLASRRSAGADCVSSRLRRTALTPWARVASPSASRAAGMVLDAVDKELDTGTSDASKYQRKLAAASQRRIELAVEERRRSQKTDLSFIEKANQRALERLLAQTSIEIGNRDKTETQTFEIDGRVVEVDDVDPWVRPSPEAASTRSPSEPPGPVLSSLRPFRPRASHPTRPTPTREGTHDDRDGREKRRANLGNRDASLAPRRRRRGTRRTRSRSRRLWRHQRPVRPPRARRRDAQDGGHSSFLVPGVGRAFRAGGGQSARGQCVDPLGV